jgi:hypothetical protein
MRRPFSGCAVVAPSRGCSICAWKSCGGRCALVASRSSKPLIADSSSAQSSALRASGPAWSRLDAKAIIP